MVGKVWLARTGVLFLILSISGLAGGQHANPDHGPELEPAHPPVAPSIVKALQLYKRSKNISAIGRYTRHRSSNVRLAALDALQHLGSPRVDAILRRMQRDRDPQVRSRAAELIEERRTRRAEKKLLRRLQRQDITAIEPLARIASPQTAQLLLDRNIGNLTNEQRGRLFALLLANLSCREDVKSGLRSSLGSAAYMWFRAQPGKRIQFFRRAMRCGLQSIFGPGDYWAPGEYEKTRPRR